MEIIQEISMFTIFYILLCACIIYPPVEFVTSGVTIEAIVSSLFNVSEAEQFVTFHIKRSAYSLFVYSLLPLGYIAGLWFFNYDVELIYPWSFDKFSIVSLFVASAYVLPLLALYQINNWSLNDWREHPIVKNVSKFSGPNSHWRSVAADIDNEFRRIDKICIRTNAICKVVATENWLLKVTPLTVFVVHQSDASLVVVRSDTHDFSHDSSTTLPAVTVAGRVQYVNIEVKSARPDVTPFTIRLNALDFRDLSDRVARTIAILPSVTFHKSLIERFTEAFKEVVSENARYVYNQELENCIGCMQVPATVKLQRLCGESSPECVMCYCRPMWCVNCMAHWFASRQDSQQPETWLSSTCTCPMCRAQFCILDVSLIDTNTSS